MGLVNKMLLNMHITNTQTAIRPECQDYLNPRLVLMPVNLKKLRR